MNALFIFYDSNCGLCGKFRRWMLGQESHVGLEFVPYDSDEARRLLPELVNMEADREIVVMADDGSIWQGPEAWVTCLWALRQGRIWARRLANPVLLPMAGKVCHLISENRITLSKLLKLRGDREVAVLCAEAAAGCAAGSCPGAPASPVTECRPMPGRGERPEPEMES